MLTKFNRIFHNTLRRRERMKLKGARAYRKMAKRVAKKLAMNYEKSRAVYEKCNYGNVSIDDLNPFKTDRYSVYRIDRRTYTFIDFSEEELLKLVKKQLEEWNYEVEGVEAGNYHTHGGEEEYYLDVHADFKS